MRNTRMLDLKDCTEFRQSLEASPPGIVHGTALLLTALLGAALLWAGLTEADLVVRAPGRVRPLEEIQSAIDGLTVTGTLDYLRRHPAKDFTVVTLGPAALNAKG